LLFAIVFMWTPPHFWALSVLIRDEYAATSIPMLPVVRGIKSTTTHILVYSVLLLATTLIPVATGAFGAIYGISALLLGSLFIFRAVQLTRDSERPVALRTYLYSLTYLALLFVMMVVDTTF
jgi:protoheme IX farnesyltransferase